MRLEIENGLEFVCDPFLNERGKIFFLHAFTGNITNKLSFRTHFKDYSFYGINFPGHGNSVIHNQSELDFNFWIKLVQQFFNKYQLKNVVLFGHSIGGGLAIALTQVLTKEQIKGIILEAPLNPGIRATPPSIISALVPDTNEDFEAVQRALIYNIEQRFGANFKDFCAKQKQKMIQKYAPLKVMLQPEQAEQRLQLIDAAFKRLSYPTLWIHGQEDGIVRYLPSKAYLESLHNPLIELVGLSNTAHTTFFEQPQQFLQLVEQFLNKLNKDKVRIIV